MKFEIKHRWTGELIFEIEIETLRLAVEAAVKSRVNLTGAYLYGARGIDRYRSTPLMMLLDQTGPIRAYKLVKENGLAPFNGGIIYEVGKSYEVADANTDETEHCAAGINVATLDWCIKNHEKGWRILVLEFTAEDIAAIPTATDGKFRLFRAKVVAEKDLKQIGVIKEEEPEAVEEGAARLTE